MLLINKLIIKMYTTQEYLRLYLLLDIFLSYIRSKINLPLQSTINDIYLWDKLNKLNKVTKKLDKTNLFCISEKHT